jgi:hypothetical protein
MQKPKCSHLETTAALRTSVSGRLDLPEKWIEKDSIVFLQRYRDHGLPFFSISMEIDALYTYGCLYEGRMLRSQLRGQGLFSSLVESLEPCAMLFRESRLIEAWNYRDLMEYNKRMEYLYKI